MATPKQFTDTEGAAIDPFAVDFFGGTAFTAETEEVVGEEPRRAARRVRARQKSDWHKHLPSISNAEAEFSNLFGNMPEHLTDQAAQAIAETLARYTFQPPESVRCAVIAVSEQNLSRAVADQTGASRVFLNVSCQPENAPALVALNVDFAKSMIDLILGGSGADAVNLRELSPIETTIIEFVAANVLGDINRYVGESLLCLQNVSHEAGTIFESFERGAEIVLRIESGKFNGNLTLLASKRFLNQLDRAQNPLTVKKSGRKSLRDYEKIAEKLDLHLLVGATYLDVDSLMFLESDDIVLIEQPQIGFSDGNFGESATLTVGRGTNFRLRGALEASDQLYFRINDITSEETRRRFSPAKFRMDELENEQASAAATDFETEEQIEEAADEQISPSLENVQVALRVEIAGNKISLRELQSLRAGQIIALGVSPNDTVRLVTDNNEEPVATGELVDIEGQLGVRLTKVFI